MARAIALAMSMLPSRQTWHRALGAFAIFALLTPQLVFAADKVAYPVRWEDWPQASGGFGTVFRGVDASGRYVAGKSVLQGTADRERRALRKMSGVPGFPVLLGAMTPSHGRDTLVMNWVWGKTLEELGRISLHESLELGDALLRSITRLHKQGLLHQDLKPGNVKLSPISDDLTVLDLGQAMRADTSWNGKSGTLDHRAPEQDAAGIRTAATDVYGAAGVIVYLATGRPPFPRASELANAGRYFELAAHRERRTIANGIADPRVREVLLKALSPDPKDRHQTAESLRRALRAAQRSK